MGTPATVTYSFQATGASQVSLDTFLPAGYRDEIRSAFDTWSSVANITFQEVPTGGQIRLFGQAIDGPGGIAGQARYPGSGSSFVRFDTGNTWTNDFAGVGSNVYQLALHEIGHTIGLLHPPRTIALMNHVVSRAYRGLLPVDIAGAQAIYGPSATINNAQYLPTNVRSLTILPTSQLTATVSLGTFFSVSDSTELTGTIDARIDIGADGQASGLTFYGGDIELTDVNVEVDNGLINGVANFTGLKGDFFSKDWFGPTGQLTPITSAGFDVSKLVLGLVGGLVDYDINVPLLNLHLIDQLELAFENVGPAAFGATDVGALGTIERVGSEFLLDIPLNVVTTIFVPASGAELPIEIRVTGSILAATPVPEASTLLLVAFGSAIGATTIAIQRIKVRKGRRQ